jgi:hypothetical protein
MGGHIQGQWAAWSIAVALVLAGCSPPLSMEALKAVTAPGVAINDEEQIISDAIRHALVEERDIPGYDLLGGTDTVVVRSTISGTGDIKSIGAGGLPAGGGLQFILLSQREVSFLARLRGELTYIGVERLSIKGDTAEIHLGIHRTHGPGVGGVWISHAEGYVLSYQKSEDGWHFATVKTGWIAS